MSVSKKLRSVYEGNVHIIMRPAQLYTTVVGLYNIFGIRDGAIEVLTFLFKSTAAPNGAEDITTLFNTVAGDAGAIAVGADGQVTYIPVNVGGGIVAAAALPKTVATLTTMLVGTQPAGPGLIAATFATGVSATGEFYMAYRRLSPRCMVYIA